MEGHYRLTEGAWLDVVSIARRLGWERSYDADGQCRSIGYDAWSHNITWCRETRRPYYSYLPSPSSAEHNPQWLDSLKQVMTKVVEVA